MEERQYLRLRRVLLIALIALGAIQAASGALFLLDSKDMHYIHEIVLGILWIATSIVIWNVAKKSTFKVSCIWTIFIICTIGAAFCVCNFPNFGGDVSSAASDTFGYTITMLNLVLLS